MLKCIENSTLPTPLRIPYDSGGSSGRQSGDRHPLENFFFNFFSVETKKEEFWRLEYALKTVF
jgi:hypothetical protein